MIRPLGKDVLVEMLAEDTGLIELSEPITEGRAIVRNKGGQAVDVTVGDKVLLGDYELDAKPGDLTIVPCDAILGVLTDA